METKELYNLLKTIDIPVAYDHFTEKVSTPFMAYRNMQADTFKADDKNYKTFNNFEVEVVTDKKDLTLENKIETLFNENDIPFDRDESFDSQEKVYHIFYDI